jgi:hypothetical protein
MILDNENISYDDKKFLLFIHFGSSLLMGDKYMPIPSDNGNPELEKKQQDERINKVCDTGACVQKEVKFNNPAQKEKCIFGEV